MSERQQDEKRAKALREFARKPFNKYCFDCKERVSARASVPSARASVPSDTPFDRQQLRFYLLTPLLQCVLEPRSHVRPHARA